MTLTVPVLCLAAMLFNEAGGTSPDGMAAVADVAITRAEMSGRGICDVVQQPAQFHMPPVNLERLNDLDRAAYDLARAIAVEALLRGHALGLRATHFHKRGTTAPWADDMLLVGGDKWHLFYFERNWK